MSSPEVSKAEKKTKTLTKRQWGPADGFRYNIDETFVLRGVSAPVEVHKKKGPRPAGPHRALQMAKAQEMKSGSDSANKPVAATRSAQPSSTLAAETSSNQAKGTSTIPILVTEAVPCANSAPIDCPDSDGGVELPKHMDTSNSHGIVFGGQVDSDSEDSLPDGPEPETPEVPGDGVEMVASCLECCGPN